MSEKIINCAIYTRKSTEEGLEQDFNSLDNQYEFCTNYLKSLNDPALQLLPARYDDGGYSGGSLNRPHSSGCLPIFSAVWLTGSSFIKLTV